MKTATPFSLVLVALLMGCGGQSQPAAVKLPRPVTVFRLAESEPGRMNSVTGLVGSWKTEQLGFEVSGRVQFVIEPETDIDGEVVTFLGDGDTARTLDPIMEGTVLARLDESRYQLAINSVRAQIETATQQKKAAFIEANNVIPAERDAAGADVAFRKTEVDRNQPLVESGATARAEFDKMKAEYAASLAKLTQVDAKKQAKEAEVASLQANIEELQEALSQAERDLADCKLRSPFRGQVAKVHVIAGGVVKAGEAVVTVQMMDPIKIDVEVSADTSRQLNYRDVVDILVPPLHPTPSRPADASAARSPAAIGKRERAFVFTIDPVADPVTRTFTVTLLLRNEKFQSPAPAELGDEIVRVRDTWNLLAAPHIKQDVYFVQANSIHQEGNEHYVWKIVNLEDVVKKETEVLNVARVKVIPGDMRLDWLGLWTFREVAIADGEVFDTDSDMVAGALDTTEPLRGNKLLLDRQQWLLRPGDLVDVDLQGGSEPPGFYVPINTIHVTGGKSYVFEVADGKARRLEVTVSDGPDSLKRIDSIDDESLQTGMLLVSGGVHYVIDGEPVNVIEEMQVQP